MGTRWARLSASLKNIASALRAASEEQAFGRR